MYNNKECPICHRIYEGCEEAGKCFVSHDKNEQLMWAFMELYKITAEGYDRFDRMTALLQKYDWDDPTADPGIDYDAIPVVY